MSKQRKPPMRTDDERESLNVRNVPREAMDAIDAVAAELSVERGSRVTRSDVVREVLVRAVREHLIAPPRRVEPSKDAARAATG